MGVAVLATGSMVSTAQAVPDAVASMMAEDLNLSQAEARLRLAQETRASDLDHLLRDRLGADYAGAFFNEESGRLAVNVVDAEDAAVVRAAGAEPRPVMFRQVELDRSMTELNAEPSSLTEGLGGWYTDTVRNRLVVQHLPSAAETAKRFVSVSGIPAEQVVYEEISELPRVFMDVIGGNAYRMGGGRCSVGFPTANGFVTAGHCGKTGTQTSGPSGSFSHSRFPGSDYAHVRTGSGDRSRPLVNKYDGSAVTVAGSREAADGTTGCRSGSTTQWHCGQLVSRNATVRYKEGAVNGLIKTTICAEPGDSGGSMIAGNQAQGVTSGGSGDCKRGGQTYFQPVNPAMSAMGVRILTG